MIDALRTWLDRPVADGQRRTWFAVAVVIIVAGAAGLASIDRPTPRPTDTHDAPRRVTLPDQPAPPAAQQLLDVPSEEEHPAAVAAPRPDEVQVAKRAARRFLAGYLPYTYGRGRPSKILAADARLRARLAHQRPRAWGRELRRRPRVLLVQSDSVGPVRAALTALVDDGARRYTVALQLTHRRSGWQITDVGA